MVWWPLLQRSQQESAVGSAVQRDRAAARFDDGQCIERAFRYEDRFIAKCIESLPVEEVRCCSFIIHRPVGRLCIRVSRSRNVMETIRWDDDTRAIAVTSCRICFGVKAKPV